MKILLGLGRRPDFGGGFFRSGEQRFQQILPGFDPAVFRGAGLFGGAKIGLGQFVSRGARGQERCCDVARGLILQHDQYGVWMVRALGPDPSGERRSQQDRGEDRCRFSFQQD